MLYYVILCYISTPTVHALGMSGTRPSQGLPLVRRGSQGSQGKHNLATIHKDRYITHKEINKKTVKQTNTSGGNQGSQGRGGYVAKQPLWAVAVLDRGGKARATCNVLVRLPLHSFLFTPHGSGAPLYEPRHAQIRCKTAPGSVSCSKNGRRPGGQNCCWRQLVAPDLSSYRLISNTSNNLVIL